MKVYVLCGAERSAVEGPMWVQQVYADKAHAEWVLELLRKDAAKKKSEDKYWITEKVLVED